MNDKGGLSSAIYHTFHASVYIHVSCWERFSILIFLNFRKPRCPYSSFLKFKSRDPRLSWKFKVPRIIGVQTAASSADPRFHRFLPRILRSAKPLRTLLAAAILLPRILDSANRSRESNIRSYSLLQITVPTNRKLRARANLSSKTYP